MFEKRKEGNPMKEEAKLILQEIRALKCNMQNEIQNVKTSVQDIKSEMQDMKGDIRAIQSEMQDMKSEMQDMKGDIRTIQSEMQDMKDDIRTIQSEMQSIQMTLENETNRNIRIVAEGHVDLNRKLDGALKIENEKELLLIRVNVLENEVRELKSKVG